MDDLEDAAELEEPFLVPGIADAAANEDGAQRGFRNESSDNICGEFGYGKGVAVHFAEFARTKKVDLLAHKWRQRKDFVEIAAARKEILVAE
jgi:hypothetical protein